jgi:hypothetical protein
MRLRRAWPAVGLIGIFAALTLVMTWPQALYLSSRATPHQDIFFNMWRLRWFAHALATPARLFDANIFFPEPRTLALSDAMLVEGLLAAPLTWAGLSPILVHNLMLLGAIALSGAAMFALVRYLTGSRGAGILGGIVFAFAPYRFEHIMHMELQWAMWTPLAFLALHRAYDTGQWRYGLAAGACVALQMLSSIYYGIFLATLLGLGAPLLFLGDRRASRIQVAKVMAAGAILAVAVCLLYARPYQRAQQRVGERSIEEMSMFRATGASYLATPAGNWLYGATPARGGLERRLFPGATPVLLAIVGLLLRPPSSRVLVYLILLVAAFEMSFGFRGFVFPILYEHVAVYRGLRALARLGLFVVMFLGILAGFGYAALAANRTRRWRMVLLGACAIALLAEYRTRVEVVPYTTVAPPIYRMLARQPRGVLAEFPVPRIDLLPGADPEYAYLSTFHWFPLVNGYSGFYPHSYLARMERLRTFPSQGAIVQLRRDTVAYVIVHGSAYKPAVLNDMREQILRDGHMIEIGSFEAADGPAFLYRMR